MKYEMKMPDLATTASAIKILGWLKQPGQPIKRGEFILEIETDKAAMEVEATVNGILLETKVDAGSEVAAGDVVAIIETADAGAPASGAAPTPAPSARSEKKAPEPQPPDPAEKPRGMFARNRATTAGTPQTLDKQTAPGARLGLSPARRTAARRLQESKQTIPHFYLQTSASAEALIARRNAALPTKLVWDAFFVKAVSNALKHFEKMAFRFENDTLVPQDTTNIGVAADIDGELFVMSVDAPGAKGIEQISQEIRAATDALRAGNADARRMKPGVMTISNLGGSGVESFSAIINPPEAAILAIGMLRPVVVPHGTAFATQHRISLTLSVDHRVVNGKYAAEFLGAIVNEIETL